MIENAQDFSEWISYIFYPNIKYESVGESFIYLLLKI